MILVLSGTKDGREIVYRLRNKGFNLIVTTATDYGKSLYQEESGLRIISRRLGYAEMISLIEENSIRLVIDATHPYADRVSHNISRACEDLSIQYIRYQRKESGLDKYLDIIEWAEDYHEAAKILTKKEGNVLLTTGSKTLDIFVDRISTHRLYPRILPTSDVIEKCEALGFKPSNIIAMQGPFSKGINIEIIKKYAIDILVTKDSGKVGGTEQKLEAAKERGISVVLISRPQVKEKTTFDNIDELVDKVGEAHE